VDAVTEYAMQTPDGAWRVEVVKRGRTRWYRIVQDDNQLDWLSIAAVHRILGEAGVDLANLTEVTDRPPGPVDNATTGRPKYVRWRDAHARGAHRRPTAPGARPPRARLHQHAGRRTRNGGRRPYHPTLCSPSKTSLA
jgi:hypothetical protein